MICRGMSLTEDDRSRASAVEDDGEVQDNRSGSGHWENECDHLLELDENQVEGTEDNGEVEDDLDWEKMHSLVRENNIAELENNKEHLAKTDENQENLFHSAAFGGNEETWTYLFDNGLKDIDQKNRFDTFPIQIACVRNNSAALKILLDKKANVDVKVELYGIGYGGGGGGDYYRYLGEDYLPLLLGGPRYLRGDDNLLHVCVRKEAKACLLLLLPHCQHLTDEKNTSGQTPREIAPQFWEAVVNDFNANWCNPAIEFFSQHLINDVAGMVVAYCKLAL